MRIAVIGGSRGCAREMVVQSLDQNQGHNLILLVRNPDNVEYNDDQKSKLTFIKGDAQDPEAVLKTIQGAHIVVSSIGSTVSITGKMTNPGICQRGIKVLLDVIESIEDPEQRPRRIVTVSSTGCVDPDEVPFLFRPMYHWILAEPHADKKQAEHRISTLCNIDWIIVRPSLLTNGALTGTYRAESKRLVGYTISRKDIGHFLLSQCVDEENSKKWIRKYAVVTY